VIVLQSLLPWLAAAALDVIQQQAAGRGPRRRGFSRGGGLALLVNKKITQPARIAPPDKLDY